MSYSRSEYISVLPDGNRNGTIVPAAQREGDGSEKHPQPVRLQPSWEESNLPEDELNFKNLTMDDASLQLNTPKDKYNLVYLTFLLHGIGCLMPWNVFINAENYFVDHKLANSTYKGLFLQILTFAAQVPNVAFNFFNIFVRLGGNLTTRIVWSISFEVLVMVVTIILAMVDSQDWSDTFFWITIITVIVLNMANGIYQNTIFGMAAKLPIKYTGAVILGSNICGAFISMVLIITDVFTDSKRKSTIYYFISALFVLLVCFDSYFALPLNRFYRHHELREKIEQKKRSGSTTKQVQIRVPFATVLKQALPQLFNVFFVFFVTLSLFPAVQANIKQNDSNFFISDKFFTSITCFLTFNICAMLGSLLTSFVTWPKPKYLWLPVTLRVLYIPFFLLCNYKLTEGKRILPILIDNDWAYWVVSATMALSSGYLSSLGMMYTSKTVEPQYATTAGMFAAASLVTGIFTGVLSSFIWPWLIENVGF